MLPFNSENGTLLSLFPLSVVRLEPTVTEAGILGGATNYGRALHFQAVISPVVLMATFSFYCFKADYPGKKKHLSFTKEGPLWPEATTITT